MGHEYLAQLYLYRTLTSFIRVIENTNIFQLSFGANLYDMKLSAALTQALSTDFRLEVDQFIYLQRFAIG